MKTQQKQFKVIDGDNMKIVEVFIDVDRQRIFDKYNLDERWSDVSIDQSGDIILFETE